MIIVELTLITAALLWFAVALDFSAAEAGEGEEKPRRHHLDESESHPHVAFDADPLSGGHSPSFSPSARLNGAIYNWANE